MNKNKEKILETMRKIKKLAKTDKVKDVKYLGKIEINKEIDGHQVKTLEDLFVLVEQKEISKNGQNHVIEIEKYITKDFDLIAGCNKSDRYQEILVTERYKDQKEILEKQLEEFDIEGLLDLNDMENDRLEQIAKALGMKNEDIRSVDELGLDQVISEKNSKSENEHDEKYGKEKLDKKELDGLQIKEETSLSQNIKGETLEDKLGLKKNGITDGVKIARVTTDSLNPYLEKSSTQVDSFVVIRQNGDAVALGENILEPENRLGTNTTGTDTTINNDGTVKQEGITSSYRIVNGNGRDYLRVGYDEVSGKEIKYGMYSPEKNDYVNVELETQRTKIQANDVRQFMKDKGVGEREAEQILEKDEEHGKCLEKDVTVIDNDKNNDSHTHENVENTGIQNIEANEYIPNTEITWDKFASMCGYRGEDRIQKAVEKFETEKAKNTDKTNKELIEQIEEQENEIYMHGGMQRG